MINEFANIRLRLRFGGKDVILLDEFVLVLLFIIPMGLCDRLGGEAK